MAGPFRDGLITGEIGRRVEANETGAFTAHKETIP